MKGWLNLVEQGREPPPQFYERPDISDHLRFYWDAFIELSSERQIGMGVGPIPRSAVLNYAREFGIGSRDGFYHLYRIIQAVDEDYLSVINSTPKADEKQVPIENAEAARAIFHRLGNEMKAKRRKK